VDEEPKVGGETQAWCTTCKKMNEHVIVALVAGRPAKVECVSCHKQHVFRAGAPGTKAPRAGRPRKALAAEPQAEPIDLAALVAGRPSRAYDPKARFAVGEVVTHPSFGTGLVTLLPGPQKVEIAFQTGAKLLTHDRGAPQSAGLTRPPRREEEGPRPVTDAPPDRQKP
jgi:hypothetical protein